MSVGHSTKPPSAVSLTSSGYGDMFIAKLSSSGSWNWAVKAGSSGGDGGYDIAIDSMAMPMLAHLSPSIKTKIWMDSTIPMTDVMTE